jgi:hypothetical protein
MRAETIPFSEDDPAQNLGTAAGGVLGVALAIKTLTTPSFQNHNHYVG